MYDRAVQLVDHAVQADPTRTFVIVAVVALIVIIAAAFLMDLFVGRAERDDEAWPHPFNACYPSHCPACWQESERRRAAVKRAQDENRQRVANVVRHRFADARPYGRVEGR